MLPLASILVLAVLAAVVLLRGQGHAYRGDLSETTVSATEGEDPWIFLDQWLDIMERNVRHREFVAVYTAMTPTVLDAT